VSVPGGPSWTRHDSPVGPLTIVAGPTGVERISFPGGRDPAGDIGPMPDVTGQLDAYFAGDLRSFDIALNVSGDELETRVWSELLAIPYGETITYGEMADRIGDGAFPRGIEPYMRARLVGAALGRNPTPIVVPCHRVIGADGTLVGFGGGIERKRLLLELEGAAFGRRARRGAGGDQLELL
jgi:methylated-DNA-[protein]-cysteine S-methyltransferase